MSTPSSSPKLLVLELWNIGDLTLSTGFLGAAIAAGWETTLLAKPYAESLLAPTFPTLRFIPFDAPWTAFQNKYQLWKWPHAQLWNLLWRLRRERFEAVVSLRRDPRDHLLMRLSGARRRLGFPYLGSRLFLSEMLPHRVEKMHRVEGWGALATALFPRTDEPPPPALRPAGYPDAKVNQLLAGIDRPILCLHPGARHAVRRWPADYFATLLRRLRARYRFHLLLIPEGDDPGSLLHALADSVAPPLDLGELVNLLGRIDLLLCNDSGPGHLSAACGRPVLSVFGPGDPVRFRPWSEHSHIIIRDLCAYRPCLDHCVYSEPYCLTRLLPEPAIFEAEAHFEKLLAQGTLDSRWRPASS